MRVLAIGEVGDGWKGGDVRFDGVYISAVKGLG